MIGIQKMTLKERFDAKWVEDGEDWIVDGVNKGKCWIWQGYGKGGSVGNGYGSIRIGNDQEKYAHRVSYELHIGPIPEGLEIDHIVCRRRKCVNPNHLRAVTHRINSIENSLGLTAINYKKTHCIRGHELTIDNLQPNYLRRGERRCKLCRNYLRRQKTGQKKISNRLTHAPAIA